MKSHPPAMAAILIMPGPFDLLRKSVRCLRAQTVRDRIEVLLVHPLGRREEIEDELFGEFHSFRTLEVSGIHSVSQCLAEGFRATRADIFAYIEDHAFLASDWVEKILLAYEGGWSCVAPAMVNGNPRTTTSRANFLMGFLQWSALRDSQEVDCGPGHNTTYRRAALVPYEEQLEDLLASERSFFYQMRADGHRIFTEASAVTSHLNISCRKSALRHAFCGGALFGKHRSARMSGLKKLVHTMGAPLVPPLRLWRIVTHLAKRGQVRAAGFPVILPDLVADLIAHASGEVCGYWGWYRNPERSYANFELLRLDSLALEDHDLLVERPS